ncbi:hypothetical protein CEP54_013432 [Fusarium duplospermum]|uniref:GPI inositol-deacylase winged helix domain-containing protein n=1 Tax=Fusarium duplospermum TaxID=1325734 RepID=A0A428P2Z8_9HYPO|nr:hypothetical protein CEP54_013432 [Fusarium duplospermum]
MGPINAATCAATVVQQFPNIRFALMIGTGGGIPSQAQDIRLGDVAVGIPGGSHPGVIQYDFGKYEQDGSFVLKGCLNKPPSVLISACHRLEEDEEETGRRPHCDILKAICEKYGRYKRPSNDDVLFKDDFRHVNSSGDCTECQAAGEEGVVLRRPRHEIDRSLVHMGLIMSGGGVVRNSEDRRRLRRGNEDAICFEMEAAGIVDQIPCLVIRGICNYADTHKNDDWRRYAAAAAAAYGKAVLTKVTGKEVRAAMRLQDLMIAVKSDKRLESMFDQYLSLEIRASHEDVSWYLEARIAQHDIIKGELGEYAAEAKAALRETVKEKFRKVSDGIDSGMACLCGETITVSELQEALAIKINASSLDNDDLSTVKSIVEACKGLVTIGNDDVIHLLHHTTREYLDFNFSWLEELSIRGLSVAEASKRAKAMAHRDITLKLLTYVSFDIFGAGPCKSDKHYLEREMSNRLYGYGSCHWVDYLKSSGPYVSDIIDLGTSSLLNRLLGNEKKWRSFIQACFYSDSPHVYAIYWSHQLDAKDDYDRTPLSYAAQKGHVDIVMSLLKAGAHVDAGDEAALTPLAYAARSGHKEVVRCLLEESINIDKKSRFGKTPLASAALNGHHAVLELLLEGGADIEEKDLNRRTPLGLVAAIGQATTVKYLLQKNANPETRDNHDKTPLYHAAAECHIDATRVLLDWGVDIDARDSGQLTPLIEAAKNGHISLVKILLQKGCDIEASTVEGKTALIYAVRNDARKTRSLHNRNYDSNTWLNSDINQLREAVTEENFEMCQLLLDNEANPNGTGTADGSTLLEAARLGRADMIWFLLTAGADPNLLSPTTKAVLHGHANVRAGRSGRTKLLRKAIEIESSS